MQWDQIDDVWHMFVKFTRRGHECYRSGCGISRSELIINLKAPLEGSAKCNCCATRKWLSEAPE